MTRKQMEEKYNVLIFKDSEHCEEGGKKYWVACSTFDSEKNIYEDGWTLKEIEEKLEVQANE